MTALCQSVNPCMCLTETLERTAKFTFAPTTHRELCMFLDIWEKSEIVYSIWAFFPLDPLTSRLWRYLNCMWLEHRANSSSALSAPSALNPQRFCSQVGGTEIWVSFCFACDDLNLSSTEAHEQSLQKDKRWLILRIMLVRGREAFASLDLLNNHRGWKPCRTWMETVERGKEAEGKLFIKVAQVWSCSC